jgi:glutamate N-acetyltransferase / amino-acid N-acetyltransferase
MKIIDGGVCAPRGFRAAGVPANIKGSDPTRPDCALVVSEVPAAIAGTFTTNVLKAPPVGWTEDVCHHGSARAVFINSGNANACTGSQGVSDAMATAERLGQELGIPMAEVAVLSTGVIGVPLPMERIQSGIESSVQSLSAANHGDAAQAIMTTDTVPKEMALEVPLASGNIHLGAMAKGSGMISPNMATMIGVITSDAKIAAEHLQPLLKRCVDRSFNCMCIDNDMSTSDAVLCLVNGTSMGSPLVPDTEDFDTFAEALEQLCVALSKALVRDAEGATKFVTIEVEGTENDEDAKTVARSIAHSQLCKTAFYGQDANWGRIACAAGYSGVSFDPEGLSIHIGDLEVVHDGLPTLFSESEAAVIMAEPELLVRVHLGGGPGSTTFWTSDLSHDYVSINADYRT